MGSREQRKYVLSNKNDKAWLSYIDLETLGTLNASKI